MNKEKLVEDYRSYMEMRGYSYTTIRNYLYILRDFLKDYETPDENSVHAYFLGKDPISKSSRATQTRIFRSFAKFIQKKYGLSFNLPEAPRSRKTLPVFLSNSEVTKLLSSARNNLRDFAILSFIVYTGVRVSELTNILIDDIDLKENNVRILGKGDKERIIPIARGLSELLKNYIKTRNYTGKYLFVSKYGRRLTPLSIQLIVKKYAKEAHLAKHVTPHKLRHTFATLALESGVNPITISELLGHSSLNTTMKYTHVTNKLTEDAVNRIIESTDFKSIIEKARK